MKFSLLEERSPDSSPAILVTFLDGYTDRLILHKHYFNDDDRMTVDNKCHYFGHLAIERDACVAMTGCVGGDDIDFTIMSTHAKGSSGFVWTRNGDIFTLDSNAKV